MNAKSFYEVFYNGNILRYDLAREDEKGKWYYRTSIVEKNIADEWILVKDAKTFTVGMCNLSDGYVLSQLEKEEFFLNLEDAIPKSKRLWEQHFAPNALWQVVEIFDDVEVKPKSLPMSKVDAKRELERYRNRPYVSYEIRKCVN